MATLKKLIITPYFGPFPEWMDLFIADYDRTLSRMGYDWQLDTDLEGFKKRVKDKLGIDYPGVRGGTKVWDYRCALGLLYEEELKGYDYWAHVDFDVIWGDVNTFLPDSELSKLDVYSGHSEYICGCFSLYRNCPEVNSLFKRYGMWEIMLSAPASTAWVEREFSRILELSGLRYTYTFHQGFPWTREPHIKKEGNKLFQYLSSEKNTSLSNPEMTWKEIMFFHFRYSKRWPL